MKTTKAASEENRDEKKAVRQTIFKNGNSKSCKR